MATRKPLVLVSGQIQQLQSGDTLLVPVSGANVISQTNDEAGAITIGMVVYNDANDGVKKAKADASGTKDVIGLVYDASITNAVAGQIQTDGVFSFGTTGTVDTAWGTSGGLVKGTRYYLSASTAAQGTATAPSAAGQYVVLLGIAISTTELLMSTTYNAILL